MALIGIEVSLERMQANLDQARTQLAKICQEVDQAAWPEK